MKKLVALAMVLSVLGTILAGCGSKDAPADSAAPAAAKDSTPKDKSDSE